MPLGSSPWFYARLSVIAVNVIVQIPASYKFIGSRPDPNLDILSIVLISIVPSAAFFLWLTLSRKDSRIELRTRPGWTMPFLPPNKFPLQFWHLAAITMLSTGAVGIVTAHLAGNAIGFSATEMSVGICFLLAVKLWVMLFLEKVSDK
jgi:hypothetical protein